MLMVAASVAQTEKPPIPTGKQLDTLWAEFGHHDDDGNEVAYQGIVAMVAVPKTAVPFLKARLQPALGPDAKRLQQCLADLDGKDFKTREKAAREIEAYGALATPALEKLMQEKLPLDVQRRVEALLERASRQTLSIDELRAVRGIEVLRGIGNAEAVEVLERLAKGADGAVVTTQSRAVLASLPKAKER
jgi:hypothetical protein